jgi:calcium/calmodulin-dependent protein kinase I
MGELTIPLSSISGTKDDWFKLHPREGKNDKGISGEIHLVVTVSGQSAPVPSPTPKIEKKINTEEFAGKKLTDFFDVGKELGRGAFAVVKVATHKKTGYEFAVKIIERGAADQNLIREIEVMKKVDHPNVIQLVAIFEDDKFIYLVMEIVNGGELFDKIVEKGSYSEKEAATLVRKMVDAIGYLHEQGIAHRDLKPENLLLKSPKEITEVKIADFGLSRMIDQSKMMQTACGTPGYVAPEVLQAQGYGFEVDMWSIGVITYILLCGFPPFYAEELPELFEQILKAQYTYHEEYWGHVSKDAKSFIDACLQVDPKKRLTARAALEHPWLKAEQNATPLSIGNKLKDTVVKRRETAKGNTMVVP